MTAFNTNKDINFKFLTNVDYVNISNNFIRNIDDTSLFFLKVLNISNNKISNISCLESIKTLEVLIANNNEITTISMLQGKHSLKRLEVASNKIIYQKITIDTLKSLKNLIVLSIQNNPVY